MLKEVKNEKEWRPNGGEEDNNKGKKEERKEMWEVNKWKKEVRSRCGQSPTIFFRQGLDNELNAFMMWRVDCWLPPAL